MSACSIWALPHRRTVLGIAIGTFVATGVLFVVLPKGFFPSEDIGQALITVEAVEDISFPAMAELLQRTGEVIRANPAVDTLIVNASESNSARLFMTLKPRSERPPLDKVIGRVCGGMCAPCPASTCSSTPCRISGWAAAPARAATSTSCAACAPGSCAARPTAHGAHARRTDFPRCHQRFPTEGLAGAAQDRSRQGQPAGRADVGYPLRAVQRLWRTPGFDDLHLQRQLPGDPAGKREDRADESAFDKIYLRGKNGGAGAAVQRRIGRTQVGRLRSTMRASLRR